MNMNVTKKWAHRWGLVALTGLSSLIMNSVSFADTSCRVSGGVGVLSAKMVDSADGSEYEEITLNVDKNLLPASSDLGGLDFQFLSRHFKRVRIDNLKLLGYFSSKNTLKPDASDSYLLEIGYLKLISENHNSKCYQLEITDDNIHFKTEFRTTRSSSCIPFPSWMCGRERSKYLSIKTESLGDTMHLWSLTSYSAD